jgi:hypothetical protein
MEASARLHGTRIFGRPCRIKNARAPRKFPRRLQDAVLT